MKKKPLAERTRQMNSVLGQWSPDESGEEDERRADSNGRDLMAARRGTSSSSSSSKQPMSKSLVRSPTSAGRTVDRRGRESEECLVSNVKAFVGKQYETVDKYEEARKKSKINRFFKGVRGIFPKRKKKSKNDGSDDDDEEVEEEEEGEGKKKREKKEKVKAQSEPREIGRGLFREKERLRREKEKEERQKELAAVRREKGKGKARSESEKEEDDDDQNAEENKEEERKGGGAVKRRGVLNKEQEHILKRSQSTPAANDEKLEAASGARGWREKVQSSHPDAIIRIVDEICVMMNMMGSIAPSWRPRRWPSWRSFRRRRRRRS